jgi:hypothetical protein
MPDLTEEIRKVAGDVADEAADRITTQHGMSIQSRAWLRVRMRKSFESPATCVGILKGLKRTASMLRGLTKH